MVVKDFLNLRFDSPVEEVIRKAKDADVVVMQRPKLQKSLNIVRSLKSAGKKVIFENDDSYLVGKGIENLANDKQREIATAFINIFTEGCSNLSLFIIR